MKALSIREFGSADQLRLQTVEAPNPGHGEIAIRVAFAGVGYVDTLMRAGKFDFLKPPFIPGIEVAGHVEAVGEGVTGFSKGQAVAALLTDFTRGGLGGYAEIAVAQAKLTIVLNADTDLATASATVVNGATAVMALESLRPGERVVVSGASGGLGMALLALAKARGAGSVVAVTSKTGIIDRLLAAGATEVAAASDVHRLAGSVDLACDTVGGETRIGLLSSVKQGGRLVILGNASGSDIPLSGDDIWLRNIVVSGLSTGGISHLLPEKIADAAREALHVMLGAAWKPSVYPLHEAADVHRKLESGGGGKFALAIKSGT